MQHPGIEQEYPELTGGLWHASSASGDEAVFHATSLPPLPENLAESAVEDRPRRIWHWTLEHPAMTARDLCKALAMPVRDRVAVFRRSKYLPVQPELNHTEARYEICRYLSFEFNESSLLARADDIRHRSHHARTDFERNIYNAQCIERFAEKTGEIVLPRCERFMWPDSLPIYVEGVKVSVDLPLRFESASRGGKTRIGAMALQYERQTPHTAKAATWHAAFIHGYLRRVVAEPDMRVDPRLCLVMNIDTGDITSAPDDAADRFGKLEAACAKLSNRWPDLQPQEAICHVNPRPDAASSSKSLIDEVQCAGVT